MCFMFVLFFKQKTAYEMRSSDWSSDVCSSDLLVDTLPLRIQCDADTRYDALLEQVQQTFLNALRHRDVPFQRIVQSIDIERRTDVTPLMQVLFGGLETNDKPVQASDGDRKSTRLNSSH